MMTPPWVTTTSMSSADAVAAERPKKEATAAEAQILEDLCKAAGQASPAKAGAKEGGHSSVLPKLASPPP